MSIGRRLSLAFGGVALVITVGAAIASWQFLEYLRHSRMLATVDDTLIAVYRVRTDVGAIRHGLDAVAKTQDINRFRESASQLRREVFADIDQALAYFKESGTSIPGSLSALRDAIADQFDAMDRLSRVGDWSAILLRLDNQVDALWDGARELVEDVNAEEVGARARTISEIEASDRRAQIILVLTGLASLITAAVLGIFTRRSIVTPLSKLNAATHQLASGDFNISLEKTSKDELGEVSEAFVRAAGKLNRYYYALKRSNEDLEQFAYIVSHDLQEPLRTITTFTQLLRNRAGTTLSPQSEEYLLHVEEAANRMHLLVTGILEYSRLTSHESESESEENVDTEDVLKIVLGNLRATIQETQAVITHDQLPRVSGSRLRTIQLFQNLIGNAIKYRRDGIPPKIHIAVRTEGKMWHFSIEDNGIGIDPKYQDQIFGIFKQLDRGTRGGVGVGLAISKRIVEQQGGSLSVASTPGEGSRFSFTLKRGTVRDTTYREARTIPLL